MTPSVNNKLKVERSVPCPGHDDKPCDYEFNYETLQKAIE